MMKMQERLLGAALGTALTGIVVFEQRKRIYESISDHQSQLVSQSQVLFFFLPALSFLLYLLSKALEKVAD